MHFLECNQVNSVMSHVKANDNKNLIANNHSTSSRVAPEIGGGNLRGYCNNHSTHSNERMSLIGDKVSQNDFNKRQRQYSFGKILVENYV